MSASHLRGAAMRALRAHYRNPWHVKLVPVGVELVQRVSADLTQHRFFNFVRDDDAGLRIQPAVGVTFRNINAVRDGLSAPHEFTVDAVTAFVFVNDLLETGRQNAGWLFERTEHFASAFHVFLSRVDQAVRYSEFFESLTTVESYIAAVEGRRWRFLSIMPMYLYALIAQGELRKAKQLALEQRAHVIDVAKTRGLVNREANTRAYDEIIAHIDLACSGTR